VEYSSLRTGNLALRRRVNTKKRVWVGEKPGLSGAAFFDLYTDPREESGKMLPTLPAKGMFNVRAVR
jgi:arylsulfatase